MRNKPLALTDAEIHELSRSPTVQEALGMSTAAEVTEFLRDYWTVKFANFITDGPGYCGELFVIVSGIATTLVLSRGRSGDFVVEDNG